MTEDLQWIDDLIQALPKAPERTAAEIAKAELFIEQLIDQLFCEFPENSTRI